MGEKLRRIIDKFCKGMEIVLAILVGIALLVTAVTYVLSALGLIPGVYSTEGFSMFLNDIFALVVGIEFIQMLLKPSAGNVIEVLVFLVTRHMILSLGTVLDILGCVFTILLLYAFNFALYYVKFRFPNLSKNASWEDPASNMVDEQSESTV